MGGGRVVGGFGFLSVRFDPFYIRFQYCTVLVITIEEFYYYLFWHLKLRCDIFREIGVASPGIPNVQMHDSLQLWGCQTRVSQAHFLTLSFPPGKLRLLFLLVLKKVGVTKKCFLCLLNALFDRTLSGTVSCQVKFSIICYCRNDMVYEVQCSYGLYFLTLKWTDGFL